MKNYKKILSHINPLDEPILNELYKSYNTKLNLVGRLASDDSNIELIKEIILKCGIQCCMVSIGR